MQWILEKKITLRSEMVPAVVLQAGQGLEHGEGDAAEWVRQRLGFDPDRAQARILVNAG